MMIINNEKKFNSKIMRLIYHYCYTHFSYIYTLIHKIHILQKLAIIHITDKSL